MALSESDLKSLNLGELIDLSRQHGGMRLALEELNRRRIDTTGKTSPDAFSRSVESLMAKVGRKRAIRWP